MSTFTVIIPTRTDEERERWLVLASLFDGFRAMELEWLEAVDREIESRSGCSISPCEPGSPPSSPSSSC